MTPPAGATPGSDDRDSCPGPSRRRPTPQAAPAPAIRNPCSSAGSRSISRGIATNGGTW